MAGLQQAFGPAVKWVWLGLYVGTIFAANWAITNMGDCSSFPCTVPVWRGLVAPSGVLFVGLSFTFRDLTQDTLGRNWTFVAILIGAGVSALVNPALALASGLAFLISEGSDMLVYTPLREKHWLTGVALSNTVGLVVDSVVFLFIAFGSLAFIAGQIVGKLEMTILAVLILAILKYRDRMAGREPAREQSSSSI